MAANSLVGDVQKVEISTIDSLENKYTTTLNTRIKLKQTAKYSNVDTSIRALLNLSTNTYQDTDLITDISVNEQMAE